MREKTSLFCVLCGLCAASVWAGTPVIPLPPFTVYGEVGDWNGRPFGSNDVATVVANVNGVEMDRCELLGGVYPSLNYRVKIPLATGALSGYANVGDPIELEVYYDGTLHSVITGSQSPEVGKPAGVVQYNMLIGTDTDGDALPDEYEELFEGFWDSEQGPFSLDAISPDDDFDGDGVSNWHEFIAGTIPVYQDDYLKIEDFCQTEDGQFALSFIAASDRSYVLPSTSDLIHSNWTDSAFAESENEAPDRTFHYAPAAYYTTLYLLPSTNQTAIRLEVK